MKIAGHVSARFSPTKPSSQFIELILGCIRVASSRISWIGVNRMPATSGDISLEGFLSSLYINLTVFVVIVLLFTLFRQCVPQFYQPRLYSVDDKGAAFRLELPGKPNVRRQKRYERQLNRRNAATYAP